MAFYLCKYSRELIYLLHFCKRRFCPIHLLIILTCYGRKEGRKRGGKTVKNMSLSDC